MTRRGYLVPNYCSFEKFNKPERNIKIEPVRPLVALSFTSMQEDASSPGPMPDLFTP